MSVDPQQPVYRQRMVVLTGGLGAVDACGAWQRTVLVFDTAQYDGILKKLKEFNGALGTSTKVQ